MGRRQQLRGIGADAAFQVIGVGLQFCSCIAAQGLEARARLEDRARDTRCAAVEFRSRKEIDASAAGDFPPGVRECRIGRTRVAAQVSRDGCVQPALCFRTPGRRRRIGGACGQYGEHCDDGRPARRYTPARTLHRQFGSAGHCVANPHGSLISASFAKGQRRFTSSIIRPSLRRFASTSARSAPRSVLASRALAAMA